MDGQGTLKGYILRKGKVRGECEALVLGPRTPARFGFLDFYCPGVFSLLSPEVVCEGWSECDLHTHIHTLVAAHTCALSWKVLYHCLGIYKGIIGVYVIEDGKKRVRFGNMKGMGKQERLKDRKKWGAMGRMLSFESGKMPLYP